MKIVKDFCWVVVVGVLFFGTLTLTGCSSTKPDTQGRLDNIVELHVHTPTMFSVLTKQGDRVILTSFRLVKNTTFVEDIKPGESAWVEYVQVGDTEEYKSATFHVVSIKNLNWTDAHPGIQLPKEAPKK